MWAFLKKISDHFFSFELSRGVRWILFTITFIGLGLFYFLKMHPILHWVHSDNAIPYLMANTPFSWADMFCWSTGRNGSPYSFFAKLIFLMQGRPLDPSTFYWIHVFLVLLAVSLLWLIPLHQFLLLLLLLLLIPMTGQGIHNLLLPGQPYSGIIFFMAMVLSGCFLRRPLLLCLGILFLFIQHALAGMLGAAMVTGLVFEEKDLWSKKIPFLLVGLSCAVLLFAWFKFHAPSTDGFKWLDFAPSDEIWNSLKIIFTRYGLVLDTQWRSLGLAFLVLVLVLGLYLIFKKTFSSLYWGGLLIGWTLFGLLAIGSSRWFTFNAHNHRYIHVISLGAVVLLVIIFRRGLVHQGVALLLLFALLMLKPMPYLFAKSQDPTGSQSRLVQIVKESQHLGCKGIVGGYWDTYFIGAVTGMGIIGSPFPYLRDRDFHQKVLSQEPLCIVDSKEFSIFSEVFLSKRNLSCTKEAPNSLVEKCFSAPYAFSSLEPHHNPLTSTIGARLQIRTK